MLGKSTKDRTTAQHAPATGSALPSQSVIGQGMTVTGDCISEGHVRVQGTVTGNVSASGLEVSDSGVVDGDISVPESGKKGQVFVVAGRVTGRVKAYIVDVKASGSVLGGIEAEEATIHGTVEGGLEIRQKLGLAATAVVSGDVRTNRLVMEDGGLVNGTITMGIGAAAAVKDSARGGVPAQVERATLAEAEEEAVAA